MSNVMQYRGLGPVSVPTFTYQLAVARSRSTLISRMVDTCEEVVRRPDLKCFCIGATEPSHGRSPARWVGGFAIAWDLSIVALHSRVPGMGHHLVRAAILKGARRLSCFDGYLVSLYQQHGFEVTHRVPHVMKGGPDVVYMELPGWLQ